MNDQPIVSEYMADEIETVSPDASVEAVRAQFSDSVQPGFAVCDGTRLVGHVDAAQLLCEDSDTAVGAVMDDTVIAVQPEMSLKKAARVMFRNGRTHLPVTDTVDSVVGVLTTTDILRGHIERSTPQKVNTLQQTLVSIHDVSAECRRGRVAVSALIPTQRKVYADERNARQHEIENQLAEPVVVVESGTQQYLADGHHRASAALELGAEHITAYIIEIPAATDLGLAETAATHGLRSPADITVSDDHHPLTQNTHIGEAFDGLADSAE